MRRAHGVLWISAAAACGSDEGARAPDRWATEVRAALDAEQHQVREVEAGLLVPFARAGAVLEVHPTGAATLRPAGGAAVVLRTRGIASPTVRRACRPGDPRHDALGGCITRAEIEADGVTTWWASDVEGLHQGWDVVRRSGEAGLRVEVEVEGMQAKVTPLGVTLGQPGAGLLVRGLAAYDDRGVALPAAFVASERGFAVEVDTVGAVGDVHIDPVYTPWAWSMSFDTTGMLGAIAGGDVNGDGFDDLVVGAPAVPRERRTPGWIYVFLGGPEGLRTEADYVLGAGAPADLGLQLAVGDLDDDGRDDIVATSGPLGSIPGVVVYAGGDVLSDTIVATYTATSPSTARIAVGDVDGDGTPDLVTSEPNFYPSGTSQPSGRVSVRFGAAGTFPVDAPVSFVGSAGASLGATLAVADLDGDGASEVLAGQPELDDPPRYAVGSVDIWAGGRRSFSAGPDERWLGEAGSHRLGSQLAVGDVTGDGTPDVVSGLGALGVRSHAAVRAGIAGTLTGTVVHRWNHEELGVDGAIAVGDLDGDGAAEVVLSVPRFGLAPSVGLDPILRVFSGGAALSDRPVAHVRGDAFAGSLGTSIAILDPDADGRFELFAWSGVTARAWSLDAAPPPWLRWSRMEPSSGFGEAVATGDLDGDGFREVILGAPSHSAGGVDAGAVYVFPGTADGPSSTASERLEGGLSGGRFGASVVAADLDGDGADELFVGAPHEPPYYGSVRVYRGGVARSATPWATWTGGNLDAFGRTLATGDIDADGHADVVVGAPSVGPGSAWVFVGPDPTVPGTRLLSPTGSTHRDEFGEAVAVGDVDGDGFDDVVVGGSSVRTAGVTSGGIAIFRGQASGVSTTAAWQVIGAAYADRLGREVAVGDLDGDGRAEVVASDAATTSGTVHVFSGLGSVGGTQDQLLVQREGVLSHGDGLRIGDLDGDGVGELVVASWGTDAPVGWGYGGRLTVWRTEADVLVPWWDAPAGVATYAPEGLAVGDVQGDGIGDLLVGSSTCALGVDGGCVWLFFGSGRKPSWVPPDGDGDGDGVPVDEDCDDLDPVVGEPGPVGPDRDADGWVEGSDGEVACVPMPLQVGDCDDTDARVSPGADEACDGIDNDCDAEVDEGPPDRDADGLGDACDPCPDVGGTTCEAGETDPPDTDTGATETDSGELDTDDSDVGAETDARETDSDARETDSDARETDSDVAETDARETDSDVAETDSADTDTERDSDLQRDSDPPRDTDGDPDPVPSRDDDGADDERPGCGCVAAPVEGALSWVGLLATWGVRRRRSSSAPAMSPLHGAEEGARCC